MLRSLLCVRLGHRARRHGTLRAVQSHPGHLELAGEAVDHSLNSPRVDQIDPAEYQADEQQPVDQHLPAALFARAIGRWRLCYSCITPTRDWRGDGATPQGN